ncbi:hypothetical protein ACSHXN_00995 [Streptomyces sp. HUAS TT11]|uniref:hypothetical protein n=1 Tax=Streptomyces sp. HUAS TT11 TaxID=3447508 RepID=UPI003F65D924
MPRVSVDVAFFAVIVGRFVQRLDVDATPEDHTSHGELERPELGQAHADAAGEFVRGQVSFMLQPGDYLIVNQRRFLHGQEALHSGSRSPTGGCSSSCPCARRPATARPRSRPTAP